MRILIDVADRSTIDLHRSFYSKPLRKSTVSKAKRILAYFLSRGKSVICRAVLLGSLCLFVGCQTERDAESSASATSISTDTIQEDADLEGYSTRLRAILKQATRIRVRSCRLREKNHETWYETADIAEIADRVKHTEGWDWDSMEYSNLLPHEPWTSPVEEQIRQTMLTLIETCSGTKVSWIFSTVFALGFEQSWHEFGQAHSCLEEADDSLGDCTFQEFAIASSALWKDLLDIERVCDNSPGEGDPMKVIGFSAGSTGREGNVDRMVKAILEKSGDDFEFVKLTDMAFSGCKGCVQLCARPQVCKLDDDAQPYYEKITEADAVVIGTPVYMGTTASTTSAFIERFYGYRHVDIQIAGKPFVTVVAGAMMVDSAGEELQRLLGMFEVDLIDTIQYQSSVPPCFKCGRHKECKIGGIYMMHGDAAKEMAVTKEMFTRWEDDSATIAAIDMAADKLMNI